MIVLGKGMVGSSIIRNGVGTISDPYYGFDSNTVDLLNKQSVITFLKTVKAFTKSNRFFFTAGKVGGIDDNLKNGNDYLLDNLHMGSNFITGLMEALPYSKSIIFSSSCAYSPDATQPFRESDYFKFDTFEETNEGYAIAKMSVSRLAMAVMKNNPMHQFKIVIPCNIFGSNDKFNETNSHVVGALITKFVKAKIMYENGVSSKVEIWGDGTQRRELMHQEDIGGASNLIMFNYEDIEEDVINIGMGYDVSIRQIAEAIQEALNVDCKVVYKEDKPTGMKTKLMSNKVLEKYGWTPRYPDALTAIKQTAVGRYMAERAFKSGTCQ